MKRQRLNLQQLFSLGNIVATPAALEAMTDAGINPLSLLRRHAAGDWGDLDAEDKTENDFSLTRYLRILSSYKLPTGDKVWIITEADRSATTFLLPSDY
jgi:hypothetical protein